VNNERLTVIYVLIPGEKIANTVDDRRKLWLRWNKLYSTVCLLRFFYWFN